MSSIAPSGCAGECARALVAKMLACGPGGAASSAHNGAVDSASAADSSVPPPQFELRPTRLGLGAQPPKAVAHAALRAPTAPSRDPTARRLVQRVLGGSAGGGSEQSFARNNSPHGRGGTAQPVHQVRTQRLSTRHVRVGTGAVCRHTTAGRTQAHSHTATQPHRQRGVTQQPSSMFKSWQDANV
eukprot:gnl/Hemi2/3448_TR1197_c0_g1_i1.p1 gnl/Hemi2/3448_TR1197_c0_g1~~gnl/Hemi2/3448_TR1197_c0_g1_i1.p1  ORF type:complete len:185 (+),score=28.18 gnl/Hemi2/3448_TR1197_c0_g1_i1:58-612(+)